MTLPSLSIRGFAPSSEIHFLRVLVAYSTYAQAATNRRYNLRRSAEEFRAHLARAEKALLELGETPLGVRPD